MATIIDPPNSVWPNGLKVDSEGYVTFYPMGTNKVDITTITWPDGDTLISPFVYKDDKLVGFVDTKALTVSGNASTTMNYSHIEADFSSIEEGTLTVDAPNANVKKFKWSVVDSGDNNVITTIKYKGCKTVNDVKSVNPDYQTNDIVDGVWSEGLGNLEDGTKMFAYCDSLTSFSSDLSSLTNGEMMFGGCTNLNSFTSDLSSLTNGYEMFYYCDNLTSFNADLSSLTTAEYMFEGCQHLATFTADLSSLTNGYEMFYNCTNLATFTVDLSSLTNGCEMFYNCNNLTSFNADLSSLTNGESMFSGCRLDGPSVRNVIDTINTSYSGYLTLGLGCDDTDEDVILFTQEAGYDDIESLMTALEVTGWEIDIQVNGRPMMTYSLRRPSENTLPVFAKLEETEKHADYTSMDGSKKYRLKWFHMTTGSTEGYTQFTSLEEAIEHFNIKPIERN